MHKFLATNLSFSGLEEWNKYSVGDTTIYYCNCLDIDGSQLIVNDLIYFEDDQYELELQFNEADSTIKVFPSQMGLELVYIYSVKGEYAISNSLSLLLSQSDKLQLSLDYQSLYEYLASHFILDDRSLFEEISILPRNWYLIIEGNSLKKEQYEDDIFLSAEYDIDNLSPDILAKITDKFEEGILKNTKGKTTLLPLSGGLDSRFILNALKTHNKEFTAHTFGPPNSQDVVISKKLAEKFDFTHNVIKPEPKDDTIQQIRSHLVKSDGISNSLVAINLDALLTTMPSEEAIVLDGYLGDTIFGGAFLSSFKGMFDDPYFIPEEIISKLIDKRYKLSTNNLSSIITSTEQFEEEIIGVLTKDFNNFEGSVLLWLEKWLFDHRGRKYTIGGTIRLAQHYENYKPFMYYPFFKLGLRIRPEKRVNSQIYEELKSNSEILDHESTSTKFYMKNDFIFKIIKKIYFKVAPYFPALRSKIKGNVYSVIENDEFKKELFNIYTDLSSSYNLENFFNIESTEDIPNETKLLLHFTDFIMYLMAVHEGIEAKLLLC